MAFVSNPQRRLSAAATAAATMVLRAHSCVAIIIIRRSSDRINMSKINLGQSQSSVGELKKRREVTYLR